MDDVFISYAREDLDFARGLESALKAHDLNVWFDVAGIYAGDEFWPQICAAIEKANTFVLIISPNAFESDFCLREIDHAVAHNKRIIPILHRMTDEIKLPQPVAARQWISFREEDDFESALRTLIETIATDMEWLQAHTRLLNNAIDWDKRERDNSLLLRSRNLQEAENWLAQSVEKEPRPTSLQTQYVVASRKAATRRQRWVLGWVTAGLIVSSALAVVAFYEYRLSEARGRAARGRLLATQAGARMDDQLDLALLLSLEAHRIHPSIETQSQLLAGLQYHPRLQTILRGHRAKVNSLAFSPDGRRLASGSGDRTIILWDLRQRAPIGAPLRGHPDSVLAVAFMPDGRQLVSVGEKGTIILWDIDAQQMIVQMDSGHPEALLTTAFSVDKKTLALGGRFFISLWDLAKRQKIGRPLSGDLFIVSGLAFSPDGRRLMSGDYRKRIVEWDVQTQQPLGEPLQSGTEVLSLAVSPEGGRMASGGGDGKILIWDAASGRLLKEWSQGDERSVLGLAFTEDGQGLAAGDSKGSIIVWEVDTGQVLHRLSPGSPSSMYAVAFSPDKKQLASLHDGGAIWLWNLEVGKRLDQPLRPASPVSYVSFPACEALSFSPDGKLLVSAALDHDIRLWDVDPMSRQARACRRANRDLTRDEWIQFIGAGSRFQSVCSNRSASDRTLRETDASAFSPVSPTADSSKTP